MLNTLIQHYYDRSDAGRQLALALSAYRDSDALVLAIPRGGVPVAYEVAKALRLNMEMLLVKKIGHPVNPEYAIGAVSIEDAYIVPHADVSEAYLREACSKVRNRLAEMQGLWCTGSPVTSRQGRTVIIIDDGIATGNTLYMAVQLLRKGQPKKIVVAVPAAPLAALRKLSAVADEVVCPFVSDAFTGVGAFYLHFEELSDAEVSRYIKQLHSS